jgi:hypothetical protein
MKGSKISFNSVCRIVAKLEGGKSNAKFGDVKQIVSTISKMAVIDSRVLEVLIRNGNRLKGKK